MNSTFNATIFRILLAIVLLAPLPLGANRPWAWTMLAVAVALLAGLWALSALDGRRERFPARRLWLAAGLFAAPLIWAALQTSRLVPADLWHPLWSEAATTLATRGGGVSVMPDATWTAIMKLTCYAMVFLLAVQLGTERARAREALVGTALAGTLYAIYGMLVYFSGTETILWLAKWAYKGDLTSTFVNRNSYGAYAGLGLVCSVALFANSLRQRRNETRRAAEWTEALLVRAAPYLVAALVIGSALLLSHSRGAFLSSGLALAVLMAGLLAARVLSARLVAFVSVLLLLIAGSAIVLNGEATLERLLETGTPSADEGRADAYRLALTAIADAPWTGHGLGAFQWAFRMYRDTGLHRPQDWQYAHNVYLEMAMDLGIPAAIAFFAAVATIVGTCLRGLYRRRRDHVYPATAVAAAALMGTHNIIDFSVQMPAIAATLALLLGVGFAQSWSSRNSDTETAAG